MTFVFLDFDEVAGSGIDDGRRASSSSSFVSGFFRSASAFLNLFMGTVKILSEYYPGRLHRAFVVDPPSLFPYLWKVRLVGLARS